ncbi:hypothetical protein JCM11251_005255 [Rhodosporidiobolus azoricus]
MLTNLALSSLLLLSAGSSLTTAAPVAVSSLTAIEIRSPPLPVNADGSLSSTLLERDLSATLAKYSSRLEEAKGRLKDANDRVHDKVDAVKARIEAKKAKLEAKKGKKNLSPTAVPLRQGSTANVLATVSIGTPAQKLPLIVDTGSSDLWVMANAGAENSTLRSCRTLPFSFDITGSSSLALTGEEVDLTFVQGSQRGLVGSDIVSIGDLTIEEQYFGGVQGLGGPDFGGVLGLSFQKLAKIDKPTFFSQLVSSGQVEKASFGLYVSQDASSLSELTLGGPNPKHYKGERTEIPTFKGMQDWALQLSRYSAGDKSVDITTVALIDSGSTSSYIPKEAAAAIYSAIPGAYLDKSPEAAYSITINGATYKVDRYVYPCNSTISPAYTFAASDRRFEVSPSTLSLGFVDDEQSLCAGTIMGVDLKMNGVTAALLGVDFLQNYYSEFRFGSDSEAPSIVFATAKA